MSEESLCSSYMHGILVHFKLIGFILISFNCSAAILAKCRPDEIGQKLNPGFSGECSSA